MRKINFIKEIVTGVVKDLSTNLIEKISNDTSLTLEGIILTGSMASYLKNRFGSHHPSWLGIPDVNFYVFTNDSPSEQVKANYYLAESLNELKLSEEVNLLIDIHPSNNSLRVPDETKLNIQLTTRVISLDNPSVIADYCWKGWKSNYCTLFPKNSKFDKLDAILKNTKRDEHWLKHMYLALVSYGNQLLLSPLVDLTNINLRTFDEGFRYLKEIAKDGVQIGVTDKEFESGLHEKIIKEWRYKISDFYEQRYGLNAKEIINHLNHIDDNYWDARRETNAGLRIISKALELREIVFEKGFKQRVLEFSNSKADIKDILISSYGNLAQWY